MLAIQAARELHTCRQFSLHVLASSLHMLAITGTRAGNSDHMCWQIRLHVLAMQVARIHVQAIQATNAGNPSYTCWKYKPHKQAIQVTRSGNPGQMFWQSRLHLLAIQATRVLTICLTLANPVPRQRGGNYSHTLSITNILIYALMVNE